MPRPPVLVFLLELRRVIGLSGLADLKGTRDGQTSSGTCACTCFRDVLGGCSQDKPAEPNPPHPPESIDELKGAIAKILARNRVPGVGIALVTKDKVIWAG